MIIPSENHLRAVLTECIDEYYNIALPLNKDSPVPRAGPGTV